MPIILMTLSAAVLAGLGAVLNFAPLEIADRLGFTGMPAAGVILQVLAGALLSLGIINWMMRRIVNGIFGRAVGLGNVLFFGVSAFGLLRAANAGVMPSLTWPVGLVAGALALGFIWLVFVGQGPRTQTKALLFFCTVALPLLSFAPDSHAEDRCAILEVQNLRLGQGPLMIAAYSDEESFRKSPATLIQVAVTGETMHVPICGLTGSSVAVTAYQDLNNNGKPVT